MDKDIGQKVTWAKVANLETILVTTGTIVEVPDFDDRGREIRMIIEYAEDRVENLDVLKSLNVMTNRGGTIPLGAVARMAVVRAPGSIVRSDGKVIFRVDSGGWFASIYGKVFKLEEFNPSPPYPFTLV